MERLEKNIASVVVTQGRTVRLAVLGLLAEGHVLVEDVPGVGKTLLAKTLAQSIDCTFKRIQFTPDLLPSDVTGTSIYDMRSLTFDFLPGPIFASIVLADEINRTGPRTQAALLEAMAERQVSVEGTVRHLPAPFMVIATQNLAESHGTFPLPDSQLDRFLVSMRMGLPARDAEVEILGRSQMGMPSARPVVTGARICEMQGTVRRIEVALPLKQYIVDLVAATRSAPGVAHGVSPRGGAALQRAAQAWAAMEGRSFVSPEDVRAVAPNVMAHRLILSPGHDRSQSQIVSEVLARIAVPV
ncbi:MAG: MoxR family ATPase [Chloroflexi bacterium]|nr:MoxR family ATPase [Chloroflexota bacterium]